MLPTLSYTPKPLHAPAERPSPGETALAARPAAHLERKRSLAAFEANTHLTRPAPRAGPLAPPASLLLSLPNEVLGQVARLCDAASLLTLRQTNVRLREVVDVNGFEALMASRIAEYLLYSAAPTLPGLSKAQTDDMLTHVKSLALRRRGPIDSDRLAFVLRKCPNLVSLDLRKSTYDLAFVECLPWLCVPKLRALSVDVLNPSDDAVVPEPFRRMLVQLESLDIRYQGDATYELVARLPMLQMQQLHTFTLATESAWQQTDVALLALPQLRALKHVHFDVAHWIGESATTALVDSLPVSLASVSLHGVPMTQDDLALFCSKSRAPLRSLTICDAAIDAQGCSALAKLHAPSLQHLSLRNVQATPDRRGVAAVWRLEEAGLHRWPELRTLDLSNNPLGLAGAAHLAALSFAHLQTLHLSNTGLNAQAVSALRIHAYKTLRTLRLDGNNLSDLSDATLWAYAPELRHLTLSGCGIKDDTVKSVPWSLMPHLQTIDLASNPLGQRGVAYLSAYSMPALTHLDLRSCELDRFGSRRGGDTAFPRLTWAHMPQLQQLDMSANALSDRLLARYKLASISKLETLKLKYNRFSPSPLSHLGAAAFFNLRTLDLRGSLQAETQAPQRRRWGEIYAPVLDTLLLTPLRLSAEPSGVAVRMSMGKIHTNNYETRGMVCRIGRTSFVMCNKIRTLALPLVHAQHLTPFSLDFSSIQRLRHLSFADEQRITFDEMQRFSFGYGYLNRIDGLTRQTAEQVRQQLAALQLGDGEYQALDDAR